MFLFPIMDDPLSNQPFEFPICSNWLKNSPKLTIMCFFWTRKSCDAMPLLNSRFAQNGPKKPKVDHNVLCWIRDSLEDQQIMITAISFHKLIKRMFLNRKFVLLYLFYGVSVTSVLYSNLIDVFVCDFCCKVILL